MSLPGNFFCRLRAVDQVMSSMPVKIHIQFPLSFVAAVLAVALCIVQAQPAVAKEEKSKPTVSNLERKLLAADKLELFSLSPNYYMIQRSKAYVPGQPQPAEPPVEQGFHDHKNLGSIVIRNPKARRRVAEQLVQNFHKPGSGAECFEPHHGLRIYEKGTTVDLVLCFDCGRMETFGMDQPGDIHVTYPVPPMFYTLFRDYNIPYEGPRPEKMENETRTTTATRSH